MISNVTRQKPLVVNPYSPPQAVDDSRIPIMPSGTIQGGVRAALALAASVTFRTFGLGFIAMLLSIGFSGVPTNWPLVAFTACLVAAGCLATHFVAYLRLARWSLVLYAVGLAAVVALYLFDAVPENL